MNNTTSLIILIIGICLNACSGKITQTSINYKGPYMGYNEPADAPTIFAPGLISTGLTGGFCNFSPEGKEVCFNVSYMIDNETKSFMACSRMTEEGWTTPEFISFSKPDVLYAYPFLSYNGIIN
jgi:hypothetical protein